MTMCGLQIAKLVEIWLSIQSGFVSVLHDRLANWKETREVSTCEANECREVVANSQRVAKGKNKLAAKEAVLKKYNPEF
jgi:hypothetical protein